MTTATNPRRIGAEPVRTVSALPDRPRDDWTADQWRRYVVKLTSDYEAEVSRLKQENGEFRMTLIKADEAARHERDENFRSLQLYNGDRTLATIKQQVALSPKFVGLAPLHCEYVARVALATGLNPEFHIHAWISKKYNPQTKQKDDVLNVTPDYKGLLALTARDRYLLKQRPLTQDEMRERGIPDREIADGAIAYVVEAWDLALKIRCDEAGVEYEPIRGYGWWAALKDIEKWDNAASKYLPTGERVPNDVSNARDGAFEAWRRATRALCYQIADLSLKFGGGIQVPGAHIVDEDTYVFEASAEPSPEALEAARETVIEGDWDEFGEVGHGETPAAAAPTASNAPQTAATPDEIDATIKAHCIANPGTTVTAAKAKAAKTLGTSSLLHWSGPLDALKAALEG